MTESISSEYIPFYAYISYLENITYLFLLLKSPAQHPNHIKLIQSFPFRTPDHLNLLSNNPKVTAKSPLAEALSRSLDAQQQPARYEVKTLLPNLCNTASYAYAHFETQNHTYLNNHWANPGLVRYLAAASLGVVNLSH